MKIKKIKTYLVSTAVVTVLLITATLVIGPSCTSPQASAPAGCNTGLSPFKTLWSDVVTAHPAYTDSNTMDLDVHEYTFTLNANQTVCSIGYQGNANLYTASVPYTIEIYNNTDATMVYSGNIIFNSNSTDYHSVNGISLLAGKSYSIRRIVSNYLGNVINTTGRMLSFTTGNPFPVTSNGMTITSSNFYSLGTPGPDSNIGIPYIDLIFEM
ncbi:hypothetical protein QWY90_08980 [Flavobacterium paronense]|uniref:Uncharacterized protein n=1 Tax=Flavobacterium paronense TaxID=1392775 RepID=A0ABV5GBR4_9FLAO|nr:hypothetical protein [Flavobacterium paronense]MDN3677451.1 hypothetical protein [Flavobacterium paronense]